MTARQPAKKLSKNQVFINQHGLIEVVFRGDQTGKEVLEVFALADEFGQYQRSLNTPVLFMIDLRRFGTGDIMARKVAATAFKTFDLDFIAIFGAKLYVRYMANMVLTFGGMGSKARFFSNRREAVTWLTQLQQIAQQGSLQ